MLYTSLAMTGNRSNQLNPYTRCYCNLTDVTEKDFASFGNLSWQ